MPGDKGWRTSLALAGLPAVILTLAAILLPETPNSLAERGHVDRARKVLEKIRGTDDVTAEMDDIIAAAEESAHVRFHTFQHDLNNVIACVPCQARRGDNWQ